MSIAAAILPEFDNEMATTRRVLERITSDHAAFKPHEKSFAMGELALHVANLGTWAELIMHAPEFDVGQKFESPKFEGNEQLLKTFDDNVVKARKALDVADDVYMQPWTLRNGEQTVFTLPRVAVVRSMVMNHLVHHRGQLTVYLRLANIPVPGVYGPSADERL